ncbi:MAG: 2-C-methyl-D-erythritol 4-phosphate cytidylyltransferase [Planctomycetota bacterium]
MKLAVIIPAAGAATRYRGGADNILGGRHKLDEDLGGRPVLQRSIELFAKLDLDGVDVLSIVVAGPAADEDFADFSLRHADRLQLLNAVLCRGGVTERYESVANALAEVPDEATHVAVHDAARPITPPEVIERVLRAAREHAAVVPGVPVADTLKRVGPEPEESEADPLDALLTGGARSPARPVLGTVDRSELMAIQTPQVFEAGLLRRAYAQDELASTDDAGLVERLGETVVAVEGDPRNIKITRGHDLPVVRALGGFRPPAERASHKKF